MADYNPNSRYTWKPEDKFQITGQQFGLILNMVRSYLGTEEAGKFMLMQQTNDVIESIMKDGVNEGVIIEALEEETPVPAPTLEAVK
tara:strand:- start:102 stop:362 length:261 start_codon:yes stop_codon:yes gene_type:complete